MSYFLDRGPKFTRLLSPNAGGNVLDHISFRFWISCLFPEIYATEVGSCVKSAQILHVFGPQIFLGRAPSNFWTCKIFHYKIDTDTDHVAQFRGDRPTELGYPVVNKHLL